MLTQHAIFVDAGHLLSQAVTIASAKASRLRNELVVKDAPGLLAYLAAEAQKFSPNSRLLRTYWYDGVGTSMTHQQRQFANLPSLHFRAGTLHNKKQKGVDSRIVQDLFELASERTICSALIITGDGDLGVGIEFAQRRGVRVAILGIEDIPNGVSSSRHEELTYLADAVLTMGKAEITKFFGYKPAPPPAAPAAAAPPAPTAASTTKPATAPVAPPTKPAASATKAPGQKPHAAGSTPAASPAPTPAAKAPLAPVPAPMLATLKAVAETIAAAVLPANLAATLNKAGGILPDTDRLLLSEARKELGRSLDDSERNALRIAYRSRVAATKAA